jgi:amino acid transporter
LQEEIVNAPDTHLVRVLGRWDLVLLFIVAITNLNTVPVIAASGGVTVWLWLLALLLFFWPQGVAVVELSQRYPGEGGLYVWAREEIGPLHGFLSGWCYWTTNIFYIPTVLFYLVGVGLYMGGEKALPLAENRGFLLATTSALLVLLTAVNVRGLGVGKWVNNLGGLGTAVASLALIGLAIATLASGRAAFRASSLVPDALDFRVVSSFGVVCFALVGLELASIMGDEIRDPRRDLPPAILWGGIGSGVLYLGATLAILLAVPHEDVGVLNGVMQAVDKMAKGAGVGSLVGPIAGVLTVSVVGIASAWFGGSARLPFVAGLDRYLPPVLGRLHPRYATPHVSLVTQAVLAAVLIGFNLLGASAKEAFVTLLDVAVVLQLVPYVYVFAILVKISAPGAPATAYFRKTTLRAAGLAGLFTSGLGMVLAFVPSHQITSIWAFEAKMVVGCAVFIGAALAFFRNGTRTSAPAA